jgi:hypothetical protein
MNLFLINTILQNALVYCNTALPTNQLTAIIRSNQGGKEPVYPFGSYLVTSADIHNYRNRKEMENVDPTKYSERHYRKEFYNVSLTLVGKDVFKLHEIAKKIYDYLNIESRDFQRENNIKIEPLNQIADRTQFLDPEYQYRIGFDFQVRGIGTLDRTIDSVDMDGTIEEIQTQIE